MNLDTEVESAILTAQKAYNQRLESLGDSIRASASGYHNDPLLMTLKQDSCTEEFVPIRLKELYEDQTTLTLVEGLKKYLSQALTEYHIELQARQKAEKMLEAERNSKNEALEQISILQRSIVELKTALDNFKTHHKLVTTEKQSKIEEFELKSPRNQKLIEDLEKLNYSRIEENSGLKNELERERAAKSKHGQAIALLKKENESLGNKLKIIEEEHYRLNVKYNDASREVDFLNSQISRIHEEKMHLEETTSFFKNALETEREKEAREYKKRVKDVKDKISGKLEQANKELTRKNHEIEDLKNRLHELDNVFNQSQMRFNEDKHDLLVALENSKGHFEANIQDYKILNDRAIKAKEDKHEAEIKQLKKQYKIIIKSQEDDFANKSLSMLEKDREKDDQYTSLLKDMSENYIEKSMHDAIVSEKVKGAKNNYKRKMNTKQTELNTKWENEIRGAVSEKNKKIDDLKQKLSALELSVIEENRRVAQAEKLNIVERGKNEEISHQYNLLNSSYMELQGMRDSFIEQLNDVNKVANELRYQLRDLQKAKSNTEQKNLELEERLREMDKSNQDLISNLNKSCIESQLESSKLLEKIEVCKNEYDLLMKQSDKKTEQIKKLEKRLEDLKNFTRESADKQFSEQQAEREKNRNALQKALEALELLKVENEVINKKLQKSLQENKMLSLDIEDLKKVIESEKFDIENSRIEAMDQKNQILLLTREKKMLKVEHTKKLRRLKAAFKEICTKIKGDLRKALIFSIDQTKTAKRDIVVMVEELCSRYSKLVNSTTVKLLREIEGLSNEARHYKQELDNSQLLNEDYLQSKLKGEESLNQAIESLKDSLKSAKDLNFKATSQIEHLENNQKSLQELIQSKESELSSLKQQLNLLQFEYQSPSNGLSDYYRSALESILMGINYLEEDQIRDSDDTQSDLLTLRHTITQDLSELSTKYQSLLSSKDELLESKEKQIHYYKTLCSSLEKDTKSCESQYITRISDLESELSESTCRLKSLEKSIKQRWITESEQLFQSKFP